MCWDESIWVNSFTKNLVVSRTTRPQYLVVLTYFWVAEDARTLKFCYPGPVKKVLSYKCFLYQYKSTQTHCDEEVKEAGVERLGEGVAGIGGLLDVEGHLCVLHLAAPLGVHGPGGQLLLQVPRVDPKQVSREAQD